MVERGGGGGGDAEVEDGGEGLQGLGQSVDGDELSEDAGGDIEGARVGRGGAEGEGGGGGGIVCGSQEQVDFAGGMREGPGEARRAVDGEGLEGGAVGPLDGLGRGEGGTGKIERDAGGLEEEGAGAGIGWIAQAEPGLHGTGEVAGKGKIQLVGAGGEVESGNGREGSAGKGGEEKLRDGAFAEEAIARRAGVNGARAGRRRQEEWMAGEGAVAEGEEEFVSKDGFDGREGPMGDAGDGGEAEACGLGLDGQARGGGGADLGRVANGEGDDVRVVDREGDGAAEGSVGGDFDDELFDCHKARGEYFENAGGDVADQDLGLGVVEAGDA